MFILSKMTCPSGVPKPSKTTFLESEESVRKKFENFQKLKFSELLIVTLSCCILLDIDEPIFQILSNFDSPLLEG